MDNYIAKNLKNLYDINLVRIPSNPNDYLKKLMNEKIKRSFSAPVISLAFI